MGFHKGGWEYGLECHVRVLWLSGVLKAEALGFRVHVPAFQALNLKDLVGPPSKKGSQPRAGQGGPGGAQRKRLSKSSANPKPHMSHSLNSLKGGYIGDYIGDYYMGH